MKEAKMYQNQYGDRFMVLKSPKVGKYKVHRNTRDRDDWMRVRAFPWRDTDQEAQADLDRYAKLVGLMVVDSTGEPDKALIAGDAELPPESPATSRRGSRVKRKKAEKKAGDQM